MSWQLGSLKTPHLRMRSALVKFSLMAQTSISSTSFNEVWTKNFGGLYSRSQCYDVIAHRKLPLYGSKFELYKDEYNQWVIWG